MSDDGWDVEIWADGDSYRVRVTGTAAPYVSCPIDINEFLRGMRLAVEGEDDGLNGERCLVLLDLVEQLLAEKKE